MKEQKYYRYCLKTQIVLQANYFWKIAVMYTHPIHVPNKSLKMICTPAREYQKLCVDTGDTSRLWAHTNYFYTVQSSEDHLTLLRWSFKHTQVILVLLLITTLFCQTIMAFTFTAYLIQFPSMVKTQQKIISASFQRLIQIFCFTFIRLTDLYKLLILIYAQFHLVCLKCFRNPRSNYTELQFLCSKLDILILKHIRPNLTFTFFLTVPHNSSFI